MAEALLFSLAAFVAFAVRNAIKKWKEVDKNIDKLVVIEKAQKLIEDEKARIKKQV